MGQSNVTISDQPIQVTNVSSPTLRGTYDYTIADVAGVVATNNFMSIFNPVASGRTIIIVGVFVSSTASGGTSITAPMRGFRVTTATGGTLATNSTDICKLQTSAPTAAVEIRIGNPTVTLGPPFFNSPPTISASVGSTAVHVITVPPSPAATTFTLAPGEGIVLQTLSGDVDQRWNLGVVWSEI